MEAKHMQAIKKLGARLLMIITLVAFMAMVGWLTDQEAQTQAQRVLARVPGADPGLAYRFAFSVMLLFLLLSTLPLLLIIAYRGLQADILKARVLETLSMCALNDLQIHQRLAEFEQRNSVSAFVLPALVNLLLLYLVWDNALLPKGTDGLVVQLINGPNPAIGLAEIFPAAAGNLTPLTWALLGAYFYIVTLTIRRWTLYDLTTNVLWQIDVRLVTTFVLGMLLMGLASGEAGATQVFGPWLAAFAFLMGIVPDVFLRWVAQQLKRVGGIDVERDGRLFSPSDLQTKIDGMSYWQVGRLAEEGIESVHDLAMKEIPTLIIQTRFDPALLLDWVDRALLCKQAGADLDSFRRAHVYTATDLIALVGPAATLGAGVERLLRSIGNAAPARPEDSGGAQPQMTADLLANIVQGLGNGPNLGHLTAYRAFLRTVDAGAPRFPPDAPPALLPALAGDGPPGPDHGAARPAT
jgi:hypothetical protein